MSITHNKEDPAFKLWQKYALVYDRLAKDFPLYEELLQRLTGLVTEKLSQAGKVLDAGCGTGNLAMRLTPYAQVTGVDYSPTMLALARKKTGELSDETIQFLEGDLTKNLPFSEHSFDVITCVHVLYALPTPEHALEEFHRLLKPNGVLLTANMSRKISMAETFRHIIRKHGWNQGVSISARLAKVAWYNVKLSRYQSQGTMHYWDETAYSELLKHHGLYPRLTEYSYVADSDLITLTEKRSTSA